MRIVHIGPSGLGVRSRHGGAVQRRMLALASEQVARGHDVTVLSPGVDEEPATGTQEEIDVVSVPLATRRPLRDFEFVYKGARTFGSDRVDVLHSHGAPHAAAGFRRRADRAVHTVDFHRYRFTESTAGRAAYRRVLGRYDVTMPVSDFCARTMLSYYGQIKSRVEVVHNGVDLRQFSPEARDDEVLRSQLPDVADRFVLYLGRVCLQKGSDLLGPLARALAPHGYQVVAAGPAGQFGIEGGSALVSDLERQGVLCTGAVHESVVGPLLTAASVVVLPTREDEMFGMAALEALACGTPVVGSRLGGIPEATGAGAVLVEPGDSAALNSAVTELLEDDSQINSLAAAGLEHASAFSWDRICDRVMRAYEL